VLTKSQLHTLRATKLDGANKLRLAMSLGGLTQVQLAAAVNVTQAYISSIVNGDYSQLPLETARTLATHFGCSIEDLFPSREAIAS
jgi:DNA-binding XRE family transcriptional regulator